MKVYAIGGKARHGKDTIGCFIKEYYQENGMKACVLHIGDGIKSMARNYFGWDGQEETKPRELLQHLGTEIIRIKMNKPYFHINRLLEDMEVLENFYDVLIIADVRLPLEFEEICKHYSKTVKVHVYRPTLEDGLTEEQRHHITEIGLDDYHDYKYEFVNTTLEQLKNEVEEMLKKEMMQNEKND